ncbi:MAG: flagellar protein FlgN [candidate division KSB1 bacterium]|nr:flagellar protein FlgN [candidate division KSB1 bacterium]
MTDSITQIIPVIEQELKIYRDLLELLQQQQTYILEGRIKNLSDNIAAQNELILKAKTLEKDRQHKVSLLADQWGMTSEDCTLTNLLQKAENTHTSELTQLQQDLFHLVNQIDRINKSNQFLIQHWLKFIRKNIEILTGVEGLNLGYSKNGQRATKSSNRRVVDQSV